ncbi:hypothetical protein F3J14_30490 [Burkholderia sp. Tr-862]|nr:hypothetical protein [Burkholderia sp. Tr-862]
MWKWSANCSESNREIRNQKTSDLSMHFHRNAMRNRWAVRAIWRCFATVRSDVTRNVPKHVTSGLANVTLHPCSQACFVR